MCEEAISAGRDGMTTATGMPWYQLGMGEDKKWLHCSFRLKYSIGQYILTYVDFP